jgi:carboxylesterase type B
VVLLWYRTFQYFFSNDSRPTWVLENLFQYYPKYQYKTLEGLAAAVLRDYVFTCSTRRGLRAANGNGQSTYMYHYTYKGDWIDQLILGDYHASGKLHKPSHSPIVSFSV